MAYTIKDLQGFHHTLETEIKLIEEENGPTYIELTIYPTEHNKTFIRDITEDWTIFGVNDVRYGHFVVTNFEKVGIGDYPSIKIKAIAAAIHRLQTTTIDGYFKGSRTFSDYFSIISNQTGISIYPMTDRNAFGWEKFGLGAHAITEFTRGVNNYGVTYKLVSENIIELHDHIGREAPYVIKNAMNADDFKLDIDRSEVYTFIEGYADYTEDDGDNFYKGKIYDYYKSPLYDILGEKKAETYKNMKIKSKELLHKYLQDIVDNSVKFTLSTKFRNIPDYPFAVPQIGDNVTVQDESINLNAKARIVKLSTYYDAYGEIYDYDIEFGNLNIAQRKRVTAESVSRQLQDIQEGRNPIKLSAFEEYAALAIKDMKAAQTEIIIGSSENGQDGILLLEKNDTSRGVWLNSRGVVLSKDAFQTAEVAINADGINAATIRTGTMMADRIMGGILRDFYGNFEWNLNTGKFYIGNSTLVYRNAGNASVYGNAGYVSGTLFTTQEGTPYPSIVLGTSENVGTTADPRIDPNSLKFSGIRATSTPTGGNTTELIGDNILFRHISGKHNGPLLRMDIDGNGAVMSYSNTSKFQIKATELNEMRVASNGLLSADGRNGIAFDGNGSDFVFVVNGRAYKVLDVINNANFT
ncbi:phage tail protein [Macrococcoides canis]|uniref:phage tail protein n=1 Tax=Macrococcoides canis TaxID=1855823 RepID=UPI0020B76BCB|nr:phage tail protein [Macrococcus canis]UTH10772.1 phage tail protein [Macrococcus canis]